jgi:hypothetical protein
MWVVMRVLLAEMAEFLFDTQLTPVGQLTHLPDTAVKALPPSPPLMTSDTNKKQVITAE